MKTYPVCLVHLEGARCVIVGGGAVAARKAAGLVEAGARPVVISPMLCDALEERAARGEVHAVRRAYREGDLEGARLAIAATDDAAVNHRVSEEARARNVPVNVVDDPDHCTFIAPAVVRRGDLLLAIATGGRAPALARRLRQQLEGQYPPAYGALIELAGELRGQVLDALPPGRRSEFWDELFHSGVLDLLAVGDEDAARRLAGAMLEDYLAEEGG